jgi:hypothetical protein
MDKVVLSDTRRVFTPLERSEYVEPENGLDERCLVPESV